MLEFVWSFLRDIVVIAIVITGFKGLNFFIEWINKVMPVSQESSTIQPYFGLEMTRWMVTMMDIVAMASIILRTAKT